MPRITRFAFLCALAIIAGCDSGDPPPTFGEGPAVQLLEGGTATDTIEADPAQPFVVRVLGEDGRPASHVTVRFESEPLGHVRLSDNGVQYGFWLYTNTDADGRIELDVQMGTRSGNGAVIVTVGALEDTIGSFTVLPGAPASIRALPQDTAVYVGGSYVMTPIVRDRGGNPVAGAVELTVVDAPVEVVQGSVVGESFGRGRVELRHAALRDTAWVTVVPDATIAAWAVGSPGVLYTIGLDGSDRRDVAESASGQASEMIAAWSPDGSRIVLHDTHEPFGSAHALYEITVPGRTRDLLLSPAPLGSAEWPRYSPSGDYIYFNAVGSGGVRAYRMRVDGSDTATVGPEGAVTAAESPDGKSIVYHHDGSIVVLDVGTGTSTPTGVSGFHPFWSADGSAIYYVSYDGLAKAIAPDGTDARTLSQAPIQGRMTMSSDGRWILAESGHPGPGMLLIDTQSGGDVYVPLRFTAPAWRPAP